MKPVSCSCPKCIEACKHNPGWFGSIREITGAAKLMNLPVKNFIQEYLIQEWYAGDKESVSIPAPRRDFDRGTTSYTDLAKDNRKGFIRASWGHNLVRNCPCIFLENDRCKIHASKPKECVKTYCCLKKPVSVARRLLLKYWEKHQDFIRTMQKEVGNI